MTATADVVFYRRAISRRWFSRSIQFYGWFFFLVMSPPATERRPCTDLVMILGVGMYSNPNRGRFGHPEARADSPQIVRGQELLPEIIRFACRLRRFRRTVLWYHEGPASPPQPRAQRYATPMWRLFRSNEPSNLTRSGTWPDADLMKNAL